MTNDGANTLVYDAENRMLTSTGSAAGAYTYDGNNLRVKKVSGSTTTVYLFSGSKVIAEYVNGAAPSAPTREYIYSGGTLLAKIEAGATKYYHRDHLSNRMVTDSSGNVSAQIGHYPYGESWYNSTGDKLIFTSYERDSESGNDYGLARYYISCLGRFSGLDPLSGDISDPQTLNRYAYVLNNPTNYVDPSGMTCFRKVWLDDGMSLTSEQLPFTTPESCQDHNGQWYVDQTTIFVNGSDTGDDSGGVVSACTDFYENGVYIGTTCDGPTSTSSKGGKGGSNGSSIWDFFKVPWSGSVIAPLVPFGPFASAGSGFTLAYNPMTDTGCAGLAAGAMVPAGGHSAAVGPLTVGNLGNADNILAGGSVFAGAQSLNPAVGVQVIGNSSGLLAGPTFGTPGIAVGVSASGCKSGIGKKLLNSFIDAVF